MLSSYSTISVFIISGNELYNVNTLSHILNGELSKVELIKVTLFRMRQTNRCQFNYFIIDFPLEQNNKKCIFTRNEQ